VFLPKLIFSWQDCEHLSPKKTLTSVQKVFSNNMYMTLHTTTAKLAKLHQTTKQEVNKS
jgi:hypothetical protein